MELIGIYLAACALLVAAGIAKVVRPTDTARAVTTIVPIPLRRMRLIIRLGSAAEAVLGVLAVVWPRPVIAGLVAVSYLAFAGLVAYARSTDGAIASCGCFSRPDTPATMLHVIINMGLAASAIAVSTAQPHGTMVSILSRQPAHGLPLIAVSAICAWLTYLAMSVMAEVTAVRRVTAISFRTKEQV